MGGFGEIKSESDRIQKHNLSAVVDPVVGNDSTEGYEEGSMWKNGATNEIFQCVNDAVGAAEWINVTDVLTGDVVVVNGSISIGDDAILVPAQITANQNDYNPAGFVDGTGAIVISFMVVDTSGNYNITGIEAPSPAIKNRIVLHNDGSSTVSLINNSGLSLAANRFSLKGNITIQQQEAVELIYDNTISRWIALTI
jgi:hypothetical protein